MSGPEVGAIAIMCGTAVAIVVPLIKVFANRMERGAQQVKIPPEVTQRLEHMEQAIDAIAVEIERISEGQRFTTKLLSERTQAAGGLAAGGGPT
ncbi:MAG: hypothetical protein ABJD07_06180 [Gemmatimonadaceae bacterium]